MTGMRTIFMVLAVGGQAPTAMAHNMPANQRLGELLQLMLALPGAFKDGDAWGTADAYSLRDLYGQPLDPGILLRQVPFPGCVIGVPNDGKVEIRGATLTGEDAVAAVARSISMHLMTQREDEEDPLLRRYARFLKSGAWQYEPTPITTSDLGMTYHESASAVAQTLLELLAARGLRCRVRRVAEDGALPAGADPSPTQDVRALVVLLSEATKNDAWMAYDVGAAWAAGLPVVPVLVGSWKSSPPNILAPYQRLSWDKQPARVIDELVELLDLTPWSIPVTDAAGEPVDDASNAVRRIPRKRPAAKSGSGRRSTRAKPK